MYSHVLGSIFGLCFLASVAPAWQNSTRGASGQQTLWGFAGADGPHRIEAWELSSHSGNTTAVTVGSVEDYIEVVTGDATAVDFFRPIQPTAVIDELQIRVEVFCSRPGVHLLAEIVLPHAKDRHSGQPLRTLAQGGGNSTSAGWQQLKLTALPVELKRAVRTMQLSAESSIDTRGAYVDRVLVRVRPGRGTTSLRLRDVAIQGAVAVNPTSGAPSPPGEQRNNGASFARTANWNRLPNRNAGPPQIELAGGVLHVEGHPTFPRAVEYFGGPLRQASELGFNIVVLASLPTRQQEQEAEAADLWLIAPPPRKEALATQAEMPPFGRVVAWHLGRRLTPVDLEATREWASIVRRLDPARGRPLIASVDHGHRAFSRVLDVVVIDRQPLCGATTLDRFLNSLQAERRLVLPGKDVWTKVQTQLPIEVAQQARLLLSSRQAIVNRRLVIDQISRLTWMSVAHGMRGLIYEMPSPPIAHDRPDATRSELLLLANQLDLINPLLTATGTKRRVVDLGGGWRGGVLSSGRTHCVLPWRHGSLDQILPPAEFGVDGRAGAPLSLVLPGIAEPSEAHLVTTTEISRLPISREAGGVRIATDSLMPRDIVLLTQDPLFARQIKSNVHAGASQAADHEELLVTSDALRFGAGGRLPPADQTGLRSARAALAAWRLQAWRPGGASRRMRSSPLAGVSEFVDADLRLATLDPRPLPTPNLMPGGDFEGITASRQAGWQHVQLAGYATTHQIELTGGDVKSGSLCARFTAAVAPESGVPSNDAVNPNVWLASPIVPLQAGDAIRVNGWVRGHAGRNSDCWAVVEDSLGGRPLSLRAAADDQWRQFVLYRATDSNHEWTCRLASAGAGEVCFDGLVVQRIPAEIMAQLTRPAAPLQSSRSPFDSPALPR